MQIDTALLAEISQLNQDYLIAQRQASEPGFFFQREDEAAKKIKSRLDYLGRLVAWYERQVKGILALVGERTVILAGDRRFDGHAETERVDSRQLAEDILASLHRSHTIDSILVAWVRLLTIRGLLSTEAAAGLNLVAPVDEERLAREKTTREKEAEYQAGFEKLKAAALAYGQQQNNDNALGDFLDTFNHRRIHERKDQPDLLGVAKDLGSRKLLPFGDRVASDVADLWAKIKSLGWVD